MHRAFKEVCIPYFKPSVEIRNRMSKKYKGLRLQHCWNANVGNFPSLERWLQGAWKLPQTFLGHGNEERQAQIGSSDWKPGMVPGGDMWPQAVPAVLAG
jgi:hypothetical protein